MQLREPRFPFIRELCVHLSEEEMKDAEVRFDRFLALAAEIAVQSTDIADGDNRFDEKGPAP